MASKHSTRMLSLLSLALLLPFHVGQIFGIRGRSETVLSLQIGSAIITIGYDPKLILNPKLRIALPYFQIVSFFNSIHIFKLMYFLRD